MLADRRPVAHTGTAQRVNAQAQVGAAQGVHVDHVSQIGNIGVQVIMAVGGGGFQGLLVAHALDPAQLVGQQLVGLGLDPFGDIGIGRATIGRVVLETAAFWRIVRRRNHYSIRQAAGAATVVADDGVGNGWRRRVFIARCDHGLDTIGSKHFQGTGASRRRQCVGIDAYK